MGIGIDVGLWALIEMDRLLRPGLLPRAQRVSIELDPGRLDWQRVEDARPPLIPANVVVTTTLGAEGPEPPITAL